MPGERAIQCLLEPRQKDPTEFEKQCKEICPNLTYSFSFSNIATTLVQPALPPVSLTGKQASLKPYGFGKVSKLANFSI
jgi:hypothetical protein